MRPFVIIFPHLPVRGMAFFPFVIYRHSAYARDAEIANHEHIHLRQQLELLIVPFYFFYVLNYLVNRIRYDTHQQAYEQIVFEREAFANDHDLDYLRRRPMYSFLKFWNDPKGKP
ncbi:MAG: hypothetical protein RMK52_05210 [Chitinophagales bacterium]|nr:hypothetical protein [Chitinophagales bacterium]MDW8393626.1 hypothetical protein [Chitinophagales bacterium]